MLLIRLKNGWLSILGDLFRSEDKRENPWLPWVLIPALYLGGAALWISFLNKGNFPVNFSDWAVIAVPRYLFLKDALIGGLLPLHISDISALGGVTDRYLAIPNTLISPQIILLQFMDVTHFILANQLLMYTLGFLGLFTIRRKFRLSLVAFAVLFLLFNFNGHILAHTGVGHTSWGGYYFFPWFVLLVFNVLEGDRSWRWVASISILMLMVFLQGSFHQYIWMLIFLGFLALTSWKNFIAMAKASFFAILISLVRILPPALLVGKLETSYPFMGGYPSLADIWHYMTSIQLPGVYIVTPTLPATLGDWEFDLYIGLVGALFLLFFGIFMWFRRRNDTAQFTALVIPMIALMVLSAGVVFQPIHDSPIPLFGGERVSSRLISLPFTFLVVLAVIQFQGWLDRTRLGGLSMATQGLLLALGGHDLWQNFKIWSVVQSAAGFPELPINLTAWHVANHPDPAYIRSLEAGLAGSVLTVLALIALVWRERRKTPVVRTPGVWVPINTQRRAPFQLRYAKHKLRSIPATGSRPPWVRRELVYARQSPRDAAPRLRVQAEKPHRGNERGY